MFIRLMTSVRNLILTNIWFIITIVIRILSFDYNKLNQFDWPIEIILGIVNYLIKLINCLIEIEHFIITIVI